MELPSTYPKSLPSLKFESLSSFKPAFRKRLTEILSSAPKALVGQEMIFDLASQITDVLDLMAQDRVDNEGLASLQEERQLQEAALAQTAEQAQQDLQKKEAEQMHRRADDLQFILDDKMRARESHSRHIEGSDGMNLDEEVTSYNITHPGALRNLAYTGGDQPVEEFDYVMTMQNSQGQSFTFRKISRPQVLSEKAYKWVYRVTPVTKNVLWPGTVVLTRIGSRDHVLAGSLEHRMKLEQELEAVRTCKHANIAKLLTFKLNLVDWPTQPDVKLLVSTLVEDANRGTLKAYLEVIRGNIPGDMIREYFAQLLDGMEYLEQKAIVHPGLSLDTVLVFDFGGGITLKIADGYSQSLSGPALGDNGTTHPQLPHWTPPETLNNRRGRTYKTPTFELGIMFLQMTVGTDIKSRFTSFTDLADEIYLKYIFQNVVHEMMFPNQEMRTRAFKVITSGLLQSSGPLVELDPLKDFADPSEATQQAIDERLSRIRRESFHTGNKTRYARDFNEIGRLGKGGFGEVVKTRNKLDNQFYAVKKIISNSESALSEIIPEIVLLSRINSIHVVRYVNAWIEKEDVAETEEDTTTVSEIETDPFGTHDPFSEIPSSVHDFMNSTDIGGIEFGLDSDEDVEDGGAAVSSESEESEPENRPGRSPSKLPIRQARQNRDDPATKFVLYIQMEYCEKSTLKQVISGGLWNNIPECWRLFRHIIDGLVYIHEAGIIHRDLKPENIFMDRSNVARIGDFGLATTGQFASVAGVARRTGVTHMDTTSIGTRHYIAPEVGTSGLGQYTTKVDMYALGIMLFEMSVELKTSHERDLELSAIRQKTRVLPPVFQSPEKRIQGEVIERLINHVPEDRPSAAELSESRDMPWSHEEDELTKLMADPESFEYKRFVDRLFEHETTQVQDHLWDRTDTTKVTAQHLLMAQQARDILTTIFKKHGAYCVDPEGILPSSKHYDDAVKFLDTSGLAVQLPYDLTMSNARMLAHHDHGLSKTFSFGNVYRNTPKGARPLQMDEADFDIISRTTGNFALKEAEVIKVLDEISYAFPQFVSQNWAIHINHADLLDLIFEYCRIPKQKWAVVKQHLANLNLPNNTWMRIKADLRDPRFNLSSSSLDELGRFNITGTLSQTREAIEAIFTNTQMANRTAPIFSRLSAIHTFLDLFKVRRPVLHNPLACYSEHLYKGSILFQLLIDAKKRRVVWAVGGRYDRLIEEFLVTKSPTQPRAVGFHLNIEEMYRTLVKYEEAQAANKRAGKPSASDDTKPKRIDVLVTSFDPEILNTTAVEVLQNLWQNNISADVVSMDELDEPHSWTIMIRQDMTGVGQRSYKVRSAQKQEEVDVAAGELVSYIKTEIRLRDSGHSGENPPPLLRQISRQDSSGPGNLEREIQVLTPQHRSKKSNRRNIIDAAVAGARDLAKLSADESPIAAIETSDALLEALRETRLSDPESWRQFLQAAPLTEQKYLQQLHDMLKGWAANGHRAAFVFNYKTKACVLYDLGRSP